LVARRHHRARWLGKMLMAFAKVALARAVPLSVISPRSVDASIFGMALIGRPTHQITGFAANLAKDELASVITLFL
jgi:hypothetical protein